jgi:hypothetical protein
MHIAYKTFSLGIHSGANKLLTIKKNVMQGLRLGYILPNNVSKGKWT